jgi:hypothetical protein
VIADRLFEIRFDAPAEPVELSDLVDCGRETIVGG